MNKFDQTRSKLISSGVREDNIDFAIDSIKDGTRRKIILESLTATYRGINTEEANQMLNEIYEVQGGEFKIENKGGYIYGGILLGAGLICLAMSIIFFMQDDSPSKLRLITMIVGSVGLTQGPIVLYKTYKGQFRHEDVLFENS